MATLFGADKGNKSERKRWVYGTWGKRIFDPMSEVGLYRRLHDELIADGILPADSPIPTNRHHGHVTLTLARCSWIDGHWVLDEPEVAAC
jgi:hypothetical protein